MSNIRIVPYILEAHLLVTEAGGVLVDVVGGHAGEERQQLGAVDAQGCLDGVRGLHATPHSVRNAALQGLGGY